MGDSRKVGCGLARQLKKGKMLILPIQRVFEKLEVVMA